MRSKIQTLFHWSLCMVAITMPFPKYSLNSQAVLFLCFCWLLTGDWKQKFSNLKRMALPFLLLSSLFWLAVFNLVHTDDLGNGLKVVVRNLPFVVMPLIILSSIDHKEVVKKLVAIFSYSVLVASLFAILKAVFFRIKDLGDFFYYTEFSKVLDIHTTYFALFIILALLYFINDVIDKRQHKPILVWFAISALLVTLYIVSSRISIIALPIMLLTLVLTRLKSNSIGQTQAIVFFIAFVMSLLLFVSPNFQNRSSGVAEFGNDLPSISTRKLHWEAVIKTIGAHNLLFGNGTGDAHQGLYENYEQLGFLQGKRFKYNAHNQFLESTLYFGLVGLVSLLGIFTLGLYSAILNKNVLGALIWIIFLIFMTTESILVRQNGIIVFSLFTSLSFVSSKDKIQILK